MSKKLFVITLLVLFIGSSFAQKVPMERLKGHIEYLSSDLLKGRKPGANGGEKAANYILDHFRAAGLELAGSNGFQYFSIITSVDPGEMNSFKIGEWSGELKQDYVPYSFSINSEIEAQTAFAGYGFEIKNDSIDWNDYEGIDVAGRWVMILRASPDYDKDMNPFSESIDERKKVLIAQDHGAAGILFVTGKAIDKTDELVNMFYDKSSSTSRIPVVNITRTVANKILEGSGQLSIDSLESILNTTKKPKSFLADTKVKCRTDLVKKESNAQNVIGILRPAKEIAVDEYIVIGGHYDHLGMGGPGSGSRMPDTVAVHNGADDNASGVAGVIELAYMLSEKKDELRRGVIFIGFDGEEMGLLGSSYFVQNPVIPVSKIKAMINLDMIGRMQNSTITIGGTGTSAESEDILNKCRKDTIQNLVFNPDGYGPSDHASFYGENIPVFFISTAPHEDYHTPFDDAERINYQGAKEVIELTGCIVDEIESKQECLSFREAGPKVQAGKRTKLKVVLGIIPDFASQSGNGLGVSGVRAGGPAQLGGIKKGDIITGINGEKVADIYEYMHRLKSVEPGQTAIVDILRGTDKLVLLIQL